MAQQLERPLLLSGDLHLADAGSGTPTNIVGPIETDAFSIKLSSKTVEQNSKANATYGQIRSSIVLPDKTTVELTFMDSGAADPLTLILMGTKSTITVGAGTVTDEAVTLVADQWKPLTKQNIIAGSVVVAKASAPTVNLVEGTDYAVNYRRGWIKPLTAGAAVACLVDFGHAAQAGNSIAMATQSQLIRRLLLDGVNLHDNKAVFVDIYQIKLRSEASLDLKGNEHVKAGLSGILETPAGATSPGKIDLFD